MPRPRRLGAGGELSRAGERIAALPMYDLPELRPATDRLWQAVALRLRTAGVPGVPAELRRGDDLIGLWTDPGLLLAQACGLPFTTLLADRVRFVATPAYAISGCEGGSYRSWVVVREGASTTSLAELEGSRAAVNAPHSQSGANALAAATVPFAAGRPFFSGIVETGAHAASLAAVREGRADCAAIDCVTFALLARHRPAAVAGLRVLAATPPAPALPLVTAAGTGRRTVAALRRALAAAIADPALAATCDALGLAGIAVGDGRAYGRIRAMHRAARTRGCARLASFMIKG